MAKAIMLITTTMTMTMLLPVAAVFLLLVRRSHYKRLVFCALPNKN